MNRLQLYYARIVCVALLLISSVMVVAQDEEKAKDNCLSLDVSLLARGEVRDGGLSQMVDPDKDKARFVAERTRLTLNYSRKWLEARVTAQHGGIWGESGGGSFNLYETWAKLTAPCGLFAIVGRQELDYDDERILGRNDWAMAAMSHDAVKVGYEGHGHKAHLILAYNQQADNDDGGTVYRTTDGAKPHKSMVTAWYHYDFPSTPLGVSLMFMNMGMQSPDEEEPKTEYQQLVGGYMSWSPSKWNIEGSYYRQMGKDEFHIPIEAWMTSVKVDFKPTLKWQFTAGYDHLSGDPNPVVPMIGTMGMALHKKVQGFCTVFGSHHKFYGAMDFFYISAFYGGYTPGLQNLYTNVSYSPIEPLNLTAGYHYLATATKVSGAERYLGNEWEFSASYDIIKDVNLSAGYTYMHGSSTLERMRHIEGKNKLHWGWLMLTVNPRLFTKKW
ncbi:MAG: alginate export family protein [Muribaculaceae bacterium]|nr:alginate export family protein [Muribaculaceae bacterium]